jgi:hypothetical protein
VPWGDRLISVAHFERLQVGKKVYYTHAFVILTKQFEIFDISEPFFIQRRGREFACGLTEYNGDLLLAYGINQSAAFCKLPVSQLSRWIRSCDDSLL